MVPLVGAKLSPAGSCPAGMVQIYGALPPIAVSEKLYGLPTTAFGSEVVEIPRVFEGAVLEEVMTIGTACDSCIVCVLRTWSWTVAGVVRLLLPIVPARVLASTTVVANAMPFQSTAVSAGKFVPVTLMIVV